MKLRKPQWILYGLIFFLIAYIALIATGFAKTEFTKKPLAKELAEERNVAGLYDFYLSTTPETGNNLWHGSENASITLIVYLTPTSPASQTFMSVYLPQIEREYIATGKVKFTYKNYLTTRDIQEKSDTFLYAQAFSCLSRIYPEQYYPLLLEVYSTGKRPEDVESIVKTEDNTSTARFNECFNGEPLTDILYDMSEVENFGMSGILPRMYIGIQGRGNTLLNGLPTYEKMKKTIRDYQVRLGD
ncbi:thioredoxin domain-containing protein [Candidatus Woesearchaeota archaeon]|nr:thioredoxin domain-containing protein [Candidatus Woesearchaeota archaeon]